MIKRLLFSIALAVAIPASAALAEEGPTPLSVKVVKDGEEWRASFSIPEDSAIWAFERSALQQRTRTPWRPESWRVLTPGVSLERIGQFDAFVAADGSMPDEVEIAFTPLPTLLMADYDPALVFSNGSLALFTGHYLAFPVDSHAELEVLDNPRSYPAQISLQDLQGQVLFRGERYNTATFAGGRYAIFGDIDVVASNAVATILDPGLPPWLHASLGAFGDETFAFFEGRLAHHGQARPLVMASWVGPTPEVISLGGSVVGDLITLRLEGEGLVERFPPALERAQWLVAHEAAHFWMGVSISYDHRSNAWITEGGADFMALRFMQSRELSEESDMHGILAEARSDCGSYLTNGALSEADSRREHRAYYACGSLFALAVEQAGEPRGEDYFDFLSLLLETHAGRKIGTDEWLEAATDFGLEESKAMVIRNLLQEGSSDGETVLSRLLDS